MSKYFLSFYGLTSIVATHKNLIWVMAKREITEKYRGQVLGSFWAAIHPLALVLVYIFIFVFVFKIKIGGTREMPLDYTTYLLSGLIPWLSLQDTMSKSSTVIISNSNLVKQLIFPIEVLPLKTVVASLITQLILLFILIVYVLLSSRTLPLTLLVLPFLFLIQGVIMSGVSYTLSSTGVYFRDIKDIVQVFSFVGMYLLPIFYLPAQVPSIFRPILYLNPFSYLIWCYQDILYFGRFAHPWSWIILIFLSHVILIFGYRLFCKLKIMFASVL